MPQNIFDSEPDFINAEGTKWWTFDIYKGIPTYFVELKDGTRTYIAVDDKKIVAESASIEGIGGKVVIYVLLKNEKITNPAG